MLDLEDDGFDYLMLSDDDTIVEETVGSMAKFNMCKLRKPLDRWLSSTCVCCPKNLSHEAFFQHMLYKWNTVSGLRIHVVGGNRFIIRCFN
jgi:hypothetical protein